MGDGGLIRGKFELPLLGCGVFRDFAICGGEFVQGVIEGAAVGAFEVADAVAYGDEGGEDLAGVGICGTPLAICDEDTAVLCWNGSAGGEVAGKFLTMTFAPPVTICPFPSVTARSGPLPPSTRLYDYGEGQSVRIHEVAKHVDQGSDEGETNANDEER